MKFNLKVSHLEIRPEGDRLDEPWIEDYNRSEIKTEKEAREYGLRLIDRFNDTLRPGERARKLLDVTFEDNDAVAQHDWHKTNLVTVSDPRLGLYDKLECSVCFITGKRYGLTNIIIDRRWRAKKYKSCNSGGKQ